MQMSTTSSLTPAASVVPRRTLYYQWILRRCRRHRPLHRLATIVEDKDEDEGEEEEEHRDLLPGSLFHPSGSSGSIEQPVSSTIDTTKDLQSTVWSASNSDNDANWTASTTTSGSSSGASANSGSSAVSIPSALTNSPHDNLPDTALAVLGQQLDMDLPVVDSATPPDLSPAHANVSPPYCDDHALPLLDWLQQPATDYPLSMLPPGLDWMRREQTPLPTTNEPDELALS